MRWRKCRRADASGFALLATLSLLFLLTVIAVAMLSLATVTMKTRRADFHQEEARANARLALMLAIGELQRELGPDQRISAPASILAKNEGEVSSINQPHWVGVWSSRLNGGQPVWKRKSLGNGLVDQREEQQWEREEQVRQYLISGNEGGKRGNEGLSYLPKDGVSQRRAIELVGEGATGSRDEEYVKVPEIALATKGQVRGKYAFWIGDLGTRANIATRNPYSQGVDEGEKALPFLAASESATELLNSAGEPPDLLEEDKDKLVSDSMIDLLNDGASDWRKGLFHHITVHSQGVLADVRDGGMKRNLTVFLNRNDDIRPLNALVTGLSENDNLVGPANEDAARLEGENWINNKQRESSPNFGLLRDWARLAKDVDFSNQPIQTKNPQEEIPYDLPEILAKSSQNIRPAALRNIRQINLNPILVEASLFNGLSSEDNVNVVDEKRYNLRGHYFPRVVLWNPYSIPLMVPRSVAMMQVNGRRAFQTDRYDEKGDFSGFTQWITWGGRSPTRPGNGGLTNSEGFNDEYTGSRYFTLPETHMGPGECLVFLPDKSGEYNRGTLERDAESRDPGAVPNLLKNTLAPSSSYLPKNNYYVSASVFSGGIRFRPTEYWYSPANNVRQWFADEVQDVQADDSQMILKSLANWTKSTLTVNDFDLLPQIAAVSCSLQYGAGKEATEAWFDGVPRRGTGVPIPYLRGNNPQYKNIPDRKTRQGYRIRWFEEHVSHQDILGNPLRGRPQFWQESFLGSWNLRASYAMRSPVENLAGNLGDDRASGPWFFGIYTRDLYDEAAGWVEQTPVKKGERNYGNPFGPPSEGADRYILFDVPREETGIVSLAQFQHAKVSELVWHPSYAIGNSLVDPRLGKDGMDGTQVNQLDGDRITGGFSKKNIGWSDNGNRSRGSDEWSDYARALLLGTPEQENLVYDLSFELNHTLWDRYFLSSGTADQLIEAAKTPEGNPLPNARMKPRVNASPQALNDYYASSSALMLDGAFNVNSTSVEAWKALLSANRRDDGFTPFPRTLGGDQNEWEALDDPSSDTAWNGTRVLIDDEVDRLAKAIVEQVRERGPFLSLSDFINRRLSNDQRRNHGRAGPLEMAIREAGLNAAFDDQDPYRMEQESSLESYKHPDNIEEPTRLEQTIKPPSRAWGAPVYLTQADLLQTIGASLAARSDTFIIRTYGESNNGRGKVLARAWCEAIVQRVPEPIQADDTGLNPLRERGLPDFGRRFVIRSFRWLNESEI